VPMIARPARAEAHVWVASLDALERHGEALLALLSERERRRAQRYRKDAARRSFSLGRGLLRRLAGAYLQQRGDHVAVEQHCGRCGGPHGKPRIDAGPGRSLEVSLSHTDDLVLCAFGGGAELGVDAERLVQRFDWSGSADTWLTSEEALALSAVNEPQRTAAYARVWTRKEALVKASGLGFSLPAHAVRTTVAPDDAPRPLALPPELGDPAEWTLRDLDVAPGHAAALAVRAASCRVRQFAADDAW
jgi:4'-phosphopantetheinyl transferase